MKLNKQKDKKKEVKLIFRFIFTSKLDIRVLRI